MSGNRNGAIVEISWSAVCFFFVGGAKAVGRFRATEMGSEVELVYALHLSRLEVRVIAAGIPGRARG